MQYNNYFSFNNEIYQLQNLLSNLIKNFLIFYKIKKISNNLKNFSPVINFIADIFCYINQFN